MKKQNADFLGGALILVVVGLFMAVAGPFIAGAIAVFGLPAVLLAGCVNRYKTGSW